MTVLVHEDVDLPEETLTDTESHEPVSIEPLFTEKELEELKGTRREIMIDGKVMQLLTFKFHNGYLLPPVILRFPNGEKRAVLYTTDQLREDTYLNERLEIREEEIKRAKESISTLIRAYQECMNVFDTTAAEEAYHTHSYILTLEEREDIQDTKEERLHIEHKRVDQKAAAKEFKALMSTSGSDIPSHNPEHLNMQQIQDADAAFQAEFGDIFKEELTITLPNPDDIAQEIQYPIKGFYLGELEEDELGETVKSKVFALPPVIEVFPGEGLVSMSIPVIKMGEEPPKMIGFELIRVPVSPDKLKDQLYVYGQFLLHPLVAKMRVNGDAEKIIRFFHGTTRQKQRNGNGRHESINMDLEHLSTSSLSTITKVLTALTNNNEKTDALSMDNINDLRDIQSKITTQFFTHELKFDLPELQHDLDTQATLSHRTARVIRMDASEYAFPPNLIPLNTEDGQYVYVIVQFAIAKFADGKLTQVRIFSFPIDPKSLEEQLNKISQGLKRGSLRLLEELYRKLEDMYYDKSDTLLFFNTQRIEVNMLSIPRTQEQVADHQLANEILTSQSESAEE